MVVEVAAEELDVRDGGRLDVRLAVVAGEDDCGQGKSVSSQRRAAKDKNGAAHRR